MSESIKLQQEAIYEMLSTEVSYIRQILTMTDIFMTSVMILKSSQRDGLLNDIDMEKLFSNIQDVLNANLLFWKDILLPIKSKLEHTGCAMNPSDLKSGFLKVNLAKCLPLEICQSLSKKKKNSGESPNVICEISVIVIQSCSVNLRTHISRCFLSFSFRSVFSSGSN